MVSASGEAIIRKIGEWVQVAVWEMDNSVRHGRQSCNKDSKQVRPVAPLWASETERAAIIGSLPH